MIRLLAFLTLLPFLIFPVLTAQPLQQQERPLARALRAATELGRNGDHGEAIREITAALDSVDPGEPIADALYLLTVENMELRRFRPAMASAGTFLDGYPGDHRYNNTEYLFAVAAYQSNARQDARHSFASVAARDSVHAGEALYWLARINAEEARLDTAEIFARMSLAAAPHEFADDANYLRAWIHEGRGSLDSAARLYRLILDEHPTSDLLIDAQLRLGVIEARRGNFEASARLLNSLTPGSPRQRQERLFYLAEVSSALDRHDEALRYYTGFVQLNGVGPRTRSARYGIGWSQLKLGHLDEAIATFAGLQQGVDSIAAAAAYQIGAIYVSRGDTTLALSAFHSLLYRLPYESFSDNANLQLARIHFRRGTYDSARHYALVTARQFPESEVRPEAYYLLGESYAWLNDATNAQYAFSRAQRVGATGETLRRALFREATMLYRIGRFHSAVDRFRHYVSEHTNGEQIADATFWLGEALYQDHTFDEAERYYNAYLERFPSDRWREQALYGLAWSRFQQRDFERAALAFETFVKNNPGSDLAIEATLRLADAYRLLKQYDRAIATYESIGGAAGKGPRDEEARYRLAEVYLQLGEVDRAVNTFRKLVLDYPDSKLREVYAYNIGSIYRDRDMDSLAITEMHRFIIEYPQSQLVPQAIFLIGDAWYNREVYDSALAYYRRILDEHPTSPIVPEALDAIRFTLNAMGRGREAITIIDEFQQRNPDRFSADSLALRRASILVEQGDYREAIQHYKQLVTDFPESPVVPEAHLMMGRNYEYVGNEDSAIAEYRHVVELYPASQAATDALIDGAGLKLRRGNWSESRLDYLSFLEHYPESVRSNEARYGVARSKLGDGDTVGAIAGFQQTIDSARGAEEGLFVDRARIDLARILVGSGDTERSLDLLASVVTRRRDDLAAEALLLRGETMMASNDLSGALAELRRLIDEYSSYPEYAEPGMLRLGNLYEQLTNYQLAREVYERLVEISENDVIRNAAAERLRHLKQ